VLYLTDSPPRQKQPVNTKDEILARLDALIQKAENVLRTQRAAPNKDERDDELRPSYDLRRLLKGGVRGKYAERYQAGTNLVLLDPDVARAFANDATAINKALRLVLQLTELPTSRRHGLAKDGE